MRAQGTLLAVVLIVSNAIGGSSQSMFAAPQAWGPSKHGLRLGIASASSGNLAPTGAEFYVALENIGDSDFVVNLGHMLGNGKVMFPSAIHLTLTDPAGTTRELDFSDRRYPGVAGRVDDFIVALRAGSSYLLRVTLNQYWSQATKEFELKLAEGRHQIRARFQGQGAQSANLDMQGVALLNFWRGTVHSNALEFEVSKQVPSK